MKFRQCPERRCIANVDGKCAVQTCGGAIIRMGKKAEWDLAAAARFYGFSKAAFMDYFGEGYIDDGTEE